MSDAAPALVRGTGDAPEGAKVCPECGQWWEGSTAPMRLGAHRKQAHGVTGSGEHRRRRPRGDRAPKQATTERKPSLAADLQRVFKVVGAVVGVADPYCGRILENRSGEFCKALARLAAEDPRIERWLRGLGKAGPYGALLVASAELAIPIAAHHGAVPPELALLTGAPVPPARRLRSVAAPASPSDVSPEVEEAGEPPGDWEDDDEAPSSAPLTP